MFTAKNSESAGTVNLGFYHEDSQSIAAKDEDNNYEFDQQLMLSAGGCYGCYDSFRIDDSYFIASRCKSLDSELCELGIRDSEDLIGYGSYDMRYVLLTIHSADYRLLYQWGE